MLYYLHACCKPDLYWIKVHAFSQRMDASANAALSGVFRSRAMRTYHGANALCVEIVPNNTRMASLQTLEIAPDYNNYRDCNCNDGYRRRTSGFPGVHGENL